MGKNSSLVLLPAKKEDSILLWKWRNDPVMRKNALNSREISFEEHSTWFQHALESSEKKIFLFYYAKEPVGMVRVDVISPTVAEISINVSPFHRGKGFGSEALVAACKKCIEMGFKEVVAKIKQSNTASINAFVKAGFVEFKKEKISADSGNENLVWVKILP